MLVYFIISAALSLGAVVGAFLFYKSKMSKAGGTGRQGMLDKIDAADQEIARLIRSKNSFIGRQQFESIEQRLRSVKDDIIKETETLKMVEQKLDVAQKTVEKKEAEQQEIKAAKDENIVKLQELMSAYEESQQQSIELEQKLASSMKVLDSIMSEVQLTAAQKSVLMQLSETVTSAGGRLRDLITEAQTVHERLEMLQQQHQDLEEEYTRLVEQQLGE